VSLAFAFRVMKRRTFLIALSIPALAADAPAEMLKLFESAAAALSDGNTTAFLNLFDRRMENRGRFDDLITGLVAQNEIGSSIEILRDEGDDKARRLELDWFLTIRSKETTGAYTRRRQVVSCRVERKGRRWTIVSLSPVELFDPPR
jgi:hypothetical protein